jgi:hypothetical protein
MNLKDTYIGVEEYFSPRIIGEVNDQYIKIAKIKGQEILWHNHENEDELFYIVCLPPITKLSLRAKHEQ